jgi:hypothetical protein
MKYSQRFFVTGSGNFPFDMLRYDQCFPATQDATVSINSKLPGDRSVEIRRYVSDKTTMPTVGRWASFGWTVSNTSTVKLG